MYCTIQFVAGFYLTKKTHRFNEEYQSVTINADTSLVLFACDTDLGLFIHTYTFCYMQGFLETHGSFLNTGEP